MACAWRRIRMRDRQPNSRGVRADDQPYGVFIDNNLGSNTEYSSAGCVMRWRPLNKIWSAAVSIDVTDDYPV